MGDRLAKKHSRTKKPVDLIAAICLAREALRLTPRGYSDHTERLDALGDRLLSRYLIRHEPGDLYEVIELGWNTIKDTPKDHPDIARRWNHVGLLYRYMYLSTNLVGYLEQALDCIQDGL
jgi:hypothetical protein